MVDDSTQEHWYWCLDHERAEPQATMCRAAERLGPFATEAEANRWKDKVAERNESWDAEDEKWDRWPGEKNASG